MSWQDDLYNAVKTAKFSPGQKKKALSQASTIIKQSTRQPRSTEIRFENAYLKPMLAAGEIVRYRYESIRLRLANGHWYKCDWTATTPEGRLIWFEVKGGRKRQREAGIAQIKVAASSYPEFEFRLCRFKEGSWTIQLVLP